MKSLSETKGILVPVDFSALTENGISHAIAMARIFHKPFTFCMCCENAYLKPITCLISRIARPAMFQ